MGNFLGKQEQELTESLNRQYQLESHPYLLHRSSNQICTLHKITTNSLPSSTRMQQIIEEYQRTKCESISRLRAHYRLEKSGSCSDEETYYLIFKGQNTYTLKEEFVKRRFYQIPFREDEIMQIMEAFLCGLREYNQRFQRQYEKIALDSLVIDQSNNRIHLRDAWLNTQIQQQSSDNITLIMQSYPSPQKLNALLSPKMQNFNQFLSNLFSVGVICLELRRLDFADAIYTKKKEVDYQQISKRIGQFRDHKLRKGLELLLQVAPVTRKQIFSIWGIENREEHYLASVTGEKPNAEEVSKYPPKPLDTHKREGYKVNNQAYRTSEVNRTRVESAYVPTLPLESLNSSRNGPIIKINTARTSSETQRINQFTIPNNQIHYQPSKSSREKPKTQISFASNTHLLSVSRQDQIKHSVILQPKYRPQQPQQPRIRNSYFSFKEYMHDMDKTKQLGSRQLPIKITQQPNIANFNREPSPMNYTTTAANANTQRPNNREISPSYVRQIPQQNSVFGNIKESFTYIQHLPSQQPKPLDNLKVQAPKVAEGVANRKDNRLVLRKGGQISPKTQISEQSHRAHSQSNFKAEEIFAEKASAQVNSSPQNKEEPVVQKKELSPNQLGPPSNAEEIIKKQQIQAQKLLTPQRPVIKKSHNSTIVEQKNEDTPDHSARSQDPIEDEFVSEEYETGSKYLGFKSGGMRNGRGKFYYQDGGYYQGQWKNNKMDGFGKLYYQGGKLAYEGQWSQDEFNGLGKVYNDDPKPFKSGFDYTNFDYLEDFWEYYEGTLVKDTKQGRGRIKLSNGEIFEGDFHEDKIQGFGKFITLQGKTIEGMWRDSKLIKIINSG